MKKLLLLGSILYLSAMGCAVEQSNTYTVFVDDKFNQSEQEDIKAALAEWNDNTDGEVNFNIRALSQSDGSVPDHTIWIMYSNLDTIKNINTYSAGRIGNTTTSLVDDNAFMYLAMDKIEVDYSNIIRIIVEHELGHAMGIHQHLPAGNIMAPSSDSVSEHLTCADVELLYQVRGIKRNCNHQLL